MDQKYIGGIGNIYALEVLFRVGILPTKICANLSKSNWELLASEIPVLLNLAIELGGSSIATYRTLNGKKGNFQTLHMVYSRENQKCLMGKCKGIIVRVVQGGRSSWYCPVCQK